ncbi:MAG TPA: hypothetical protein DDW19_01275 [Anaerolineaceae bacterium]|jgi:hypothetical protein|nr:hypothetical protein [Anaerolineaceae bacterium]
MSEKKIESQDAPDADKIATEKSQPRKPSAVPLEKIGTLRFADKAGNLYYLDEQWGGQFFLRPIRE